MPVTRLFRGAGTVYPNLAKSMVAGCAIACGVALIPGVAAGQQESAGSNAMLRPQQMPDDTGDAGRTGAGTASPPGELKPKPLRVLSWDVSTTPYVIAMRKIKMSKPSWRTTFGSERRTIDAPEPPQTATLDADIVLMQGVTNPRALRRLFPARRWRVIYSRRALRKLPRGSVFTRPLSDVEIEGIAVRYRKGMRIIRRAQDLGHAVNQPGQPEVSGVAARIMEAGKTYRLASVAVPQACLKEKAACLAIEKLEEWQRQHESNGEKVLAGGLVSAPPEQAAECQRQAVGLMLFGRQSSKPSVPRTHKTLGCIARLTLP